MMDAAHEKLAELENYLRSRIRGQDHVINRVASVLRRGELGLSHPSRPKGSFLFIGPTGVGKTELATCFTEYIFGPECLHRFDMSEYQNQSSVGLLLGESPSEGGMLGHALARSSQGTLLFDEMEKAHPLILDLFLQILDAGRITLANGETKKLGGYYIVFTSNIGSSEAMRMEHSVFSAIERTVLRKVDQTLRPELVGRITEKVVFGRLSYDTQREICEGMIQKEAKRLQGMGHQVIITPELIEQLIREGYHRTLGARPMRNVVEKRLQEWVCTSLTIKRNREGQ